MRWCVANRGFEGGRGYVLSRVIEGVMSALLNGGIHVSGSVPNPPVLRRTGRTAGCSPSFFKSTNGLGQIEVGPDAAWNSFRCVSWARMLRNARFVVSSCLCFIIRQIICHIMPKLISKKEYADLRESIEFPSNSSGKSQGLSCRSALFALVPCDIITSIILIHIFKWDPTIRIFSQPTALHKS